MDTNRELLIKIEALKAVLIARARGENVTEHGQQYVDLRKEIIAVTNLQDNLPRFVLSYRSLQEFWRFIQPKYKRYAEREKYIQEEFEPILNLLELGQDIGSSYLKTNDLFRYQFPAGLPFGLRKPSLAFVPEQGTQKPRFEDEENIGVIRNDVYPNLTYGKLQNLLQETPVINNKALPPVLFDMNQTDNEKHFFQVTGRIFSY